jgi:prepilin-type N-terminal cleavage/methylation domain-containing protein
VISKHAACDPTLDGFAAVPPPSSIPHRRSTSLLRASVSAPIHYRFRRQRFAVIAVNFRSSFRTRHSPAKPNPREGWSLASPPWLRGFTLIELMVVIGIITILTVLVVPAVTNLKTSGDITNAAYAISGALEQARSHALGNNTYVWVGFYEEDISQSSTSPATPGTGRVVISIVASKDGTIIYDPGNLGPIDPTRLTQIGKLIKLENAHLTTFTDGTGTGTTFDTRPPVSFTTARIGDTSPPSGSLTPFQYPVGTPAPTAQYTFLKAIQFSPQGEARINNNNFTLKTVAEVGLRQTHGTVVDAVSPNVVAIQFSAISGDTKVYRR